MFVHTCWSVSKRVGSYSPSLALIAIVITVCCIKKKNRSSCMGLTDIWLLNYFHTINTALELLLHCQSSLHHFQYAEKEWWNNWPVSIAFKIVVTLSASKSWVFLLLLLFVLIKVYIISFLTSDPRSIFIHHPSSPTWTADNVNFACWNKF